MREDGATSSKKKYHRSMAKAIRAKCVDCCCGNRREVDKCVLKDCPLWAFRHGYAVDDAGNKI